MDKRDEKQSCQVVINFEGTYCIWPADWQMPACYRPAGKTRTKEECLVFIEEIRTGLQQSGFRKSQGTNCRKKAKEEP